MNESLQAFKWHPSASLDCLRQRAKFIAAVRTFFVERGVWEVETPILSSAANPEAGIHAVSTYAAYGSNQATRHWLQSSPEFAMKRLLAAGSGAIFQIARVFRGGESGSLHNPEFTMLEWYRPDFDTSALMTEVTTLIDRVLGVNPCQRLSYRQAFLNSDIGLDPFTVSDATLQQVCLAAGFSPTAIPLSRNQSLDYLLTAKIMPMLVNKRCFVYDFPPTKASYALIKQGTPPLADRFELYVNGIEIANGYQELTDADQQLERFTHEQRLRSENKLEEVPIDTRLLGALAHGLPMCAGVAVGLDRLLMLALGAERISEVMAFATDYV